MEPIQKQKCKGKVNGFTLVELIVVITILSILSVIAIIWMSQYMSHSRDSVRMTEIKSIFTWLAMYKAQSDRYPLPDEPLKLIVNPSHPDTISGSYYQWVAWENVKRIARLNGKWEDPTLSTSYVYATNYTKTWAMLMAYLEDGSDFGIAFQNAVSPTYATEITSITNEFWNTKSYLYGDGVWFGILTDADKNSYSSASCNHTTIVCTSWPDAPILDTNNLEDTRYYRSNDEVVTGTGVQKAIVADATGTNPCDAETYNGYEVTVLAHYQTGTFLKNMNILHAIWAQGSMQIHCDNGTLEKDIAVETIDISCESWYARDGNICVSDVCMWNIPTNAHLNGTQQYNKPWAFNASVGWVCSFACDTNYTWNGTVCSADSQSATCNGSVPANAHDNSTFTSRQQEWDGTVWAPEYTYRNSATSDMCTFACDAGFTWNNGYCEKNVFNVSGTFWVAGAWADVVVCGSHVTADGDGFFSVNGISYQTDCSGVSASKSNYTCTTTKDGPASLTTDVSDIEWNCSPNNQTSNCTWLPDNAHWNTVSSITQTWNGTSWSPSLTWVYQDTPSTMNCVFDCDMHYRYQAGSNTCTLDSYVVSFDANGGTPDSQKTVAHGSPIGTLPTPSRTWYDFLGWYTSQAWGSLIGTTTNIVGTLTVYAHWDLQIFTVSGSFGANGSWATVNICGKTVTANASGAFSLTGAYNAVCNTLTANKSGYECTTTDNGPAFLTSNSTGLWGSCTLTQNGTCGTADWKSRITKPSTTNDLCSVGTPTTVSGSGPWSWTCQWLSWGSDGNCTTILLIAPTASSATPSQTSIQWNWSNGGGTPGKYQFSTNGSTWLDMGTVLASEENPMTCNTSYSGRQVRACDDTWACTTATTLAFSTTTACPINGTCGSANGSNLVTAPSGTTLCTSGIAGTVSGTGPWTWTCSAQNGGTSVNCSANPTPCGAQAMSVNTHTYNVWAFAHSGTSTVVSVSVAITWGNITYSQPFKCLYGTVSTNGSETTNTPTCNTNYSVSGNTCVAKTQTFTCVAKPTTGTLRNTVSSYSQTWNGTAWNPASTTTSYNVTASTTACRYKCATNYTWNATTSTCVANTQTFTCVAKPTAGTVWNTVSTYAQTRNGTAWSPVDSTTAYNATASATACRYKCATNYTRNATLGACKYVCPTGFEEYNWYCITGMKWPASISTAMTTCSNSGATINSQDSCGAHSTDNSTAPCNNDTKKSYCLKRTRSNINGTEYRIWLRLLNDGGWFTLYSTSYDNAYAKSKTMDFVIFDKTYGGCGWWDNSHYYRCTILIQ